MTRDQFTLKALVLAVSWTAVGLAFARLAVAQATLQPSGFIACCAAGLAFGIASSWLTTSRYQAALVGVIAWFAVGALAIPAVPYH